MDSGGLCRTVECHEITREGREIITTNTSEETLNRVLDNECDPQEAIDYRG